MAVRSAYLPSFELHLRKPSTWVVASQRPQAPCSGLLLLADIAGRQCPVFQAADTHVCGALPQPGCELLPFVPEAHGKSVIVPPSQLCRVTIDN